MDLEKPTEEQVASFKEVTIESQIAAVEASIKYFGSLRLFGDNRPKALRAVLAGLRKERKSINAQKRRTYKKWKDF